MIDTCGDCIHWDEGKSYCDYNGRDYVYHNTSACAAGRGEYDYDFEDSYEDEEDDNLIEEE